jgi:hypothetical protein
LRYNSSGDIPSDVSRFIATLLGRNHARTHRAAVSAAKALEYATAFDNEYLSSLWGEILHAFLDTIRLSGQSKLAELDLDQREIFSRALPILANLLANKKETLIHGELDCTNILFREKDDADEDQGSDAELSLHLKAVDFETCRYGPAGLDMGMFLGSYCYYYVAHSLPVPRRNLLSQTAAAVDAYRTAFRIQFEAACKATSRDGVLPSSSSSSSSSSHVDRVLNHILADAAGFAGLTLLLRVCGVPALGRPLSLDAVPGCAWGDREGRQRAVRRRLLRMAARLLDLFLLHSPSLALSSVEQHAGPSPAITAEDFLKALRSDDTHLLTDHYTEFWG